MKIFFVNVWFLVIDTNYFIPKESNIFQFQAILMNKGSGDWWLYGEDRKNYYGLNIKNTNPKYFMIVKDKIIKSPNFDKTNYNTWNN